MSSSDFPTCSKFIKSKSVNNKIIDYYLKYAKDRDIEKFMRFNNSSASGSSCCPCPSKSSSGSDDNNLVSEELILALHPCEMLSEAVNEPDKENTSREANKNMTEPRTPPKSLSEINFQIPDSVTKIDKKLEWDSLGDVGYKKANSTGNLSSLERSVLKELFSESPSVPNIPHQRSDEIKPTSTHSLSAESRREKWRQTLENLGKKYSSRSTSLNTQEFMELPQSTPKVVPNTDKSCQTTLEKTNILVKTRTNHSCQTSFDRSKLPAPSSQLKSQETQANLSSSRASSQLKSQEAQANLSSRAESFATQSSFEYHAGDDRRASESSQKSTTRRSILSEKNTKSHSSSSATENQLTKRSNRCKTEVDLGIKLLCSLIDAKNLTGTQKKHLAKKIFEKITKQQSSEVSSSSVSSAFSVRSLIESSPLCEDQKEIASQSSGNKITIQQMTEETQTEEPPRVGEDQNPPQSSPSLEEPVTMREWLHPLTRSEKDYEKKLKQKSQAISTSSMQHASERSKQLSWIEMEINRLEGLKNLILQDCPSSRSRSHSSSSTIKSSKGKSEIIYEETAEDLVNEEDQYKRTMRRTSQNVVIYDEPTADKQQPEKVSYKTINQGEQQPTTSSSSSLKKNHRSKLETPSSSPSTERESVGAFADQLQKQFMDNYEKKKKKKHTMSVEHYSEPRICGKPVFTRNPSYTSVASSASPFCMSSEMSIPIVESTSTSTTTHQYDSNGCESIEGVAIQTSYSVIKSDPIFGPRCRCICTCGKECKCSCPRPTVRVSGTAFHQTVQVKPKALAYVIRFGETADGQGNKLTDDGVSLQKRLEMKNPDFFSKANERREILKKLHALRQEREERIREIADCSSVSSISRKLGELPPPPIKQVRICPSREMKGMTKKRYCKLPEVVAKQEREKLERRKKTTRVITNIFNKKLQRMVHKGKLSLENSRTVI